jgi:hypothetical protein
MLQRSKQKETCQCCASIYPQFTYQWYSFRYCLTCLHSIGVNARGNPCTKADYRRAWHELLHGKASIEALRDRHNRTSNAARPR